MGALCAGVTAIALLAYADAPRLSTTSPGFGANTAYTVNAVSPATVTFGEPYARASWEPYAAAPGHAISFGPPTATTAAARPKPQPAVTLLSTTPTVSGNKVQLKLHCSDAICRGTITLYHGTTLLAVSGYAMFMGTTTGWATHLKNQALLLLVNARYHTLNATETVTVTGGNTVRKQIALIGPAITALTPRPTVSADRVELKLRCSGATCRGTIWLNYNRLSLASKSYGMLAGTTSAWTALLNKEAMNLLARAKYHTLNVTETVTVGDGPTARLSVTLVGQLLPLPPLGG
jgi:hypothetical protein